jgi:hypothetical protein
VLQCALGVRSGSFATLGTSRSAAPHPRADTRGSIRRSSIAAELAKRIPIRHFIDHGPTIQPTPAFDEFLTKIYPQLYAKAKHTVAKPGDKISVAGLDVQVVTSAGETIKAALPGAGAPNPYCASFKPGDKYDEDMMSVGVIISFRRFKSEVQQCSIDGMAE